MSVFISFDDDSVFFKALDVNVEMISWKDFFSISWFDIVALYWRVFSLAVAVTFFSIVSQRWVALEMEWLNIDMIGIFRSEKTMELDHYESEYSIDRAKSVPSTEYLLERTHKHTHTFSDE